MGRYSKSKKCREKYCQGVINVSNQYQTNGGNALCSCSICGRFYEYNGSTLKGATKSNGKKEFMFVLKLS